MAWRSILVHLDDDDPRCEARVDIAARLARDRDARLVGVAPTGWVEWMYPTLPPPVGIERERAAAAAQRFRQRAAELRLESAAGVEEEGETAQVIVQQGHASDLIVTGQTDPNRHGHRRAQDVLERVVLHASRPVLVVPYAGTFETVGRRVLAGWNGGREAARALADAMPLLCNATDVEVVSLDEPDGVRDAHREAALQALSQWLLSHGVPARVRSQALGSGMEAGDALLSHAADAGSDLIVMGAYGHARWSERVLGGATRTLLRSMTVPVLMSR